MELKTRTRKWGNSLAVIIPAALAERERITENQDVTVRIEKQRPTLQSVWGLGKGKFKQSTQEIKDEARAGWMSDSDRKQEEEWKKSQK